MSVSSTSRAMPLATVAKSKGLPHWPDVATKDEIPDWLKDNEFIISGHPMPTYSYLRSLRLWRFLHMETCNIWTHFLGSVGFVATGIGLHRLVVASDVNMTIGDRFAFGISLTSAAVCFGLSATFHTLRSHSYRIHHLWGKMDILGICVLALGGGCSANYYASACAPVAQKVYWALCSASAPAAAYTLFDTGGGGSKMRMLRGGVFGMLALAAMLPVLHGIGRLGWSQACVQFGVQWYLAEGLWLLLGVGLFVGRIPERLRPGSFDIWGHSHQLFHVAAVTGTAFHVVALTAGMMYRQDHRLDC